MDLREMQNIHIKDIDPSMVVDASSIKIDTELPQVERMVSAIKQMGNPYFFKVGKIIVKTCFAETDITINKRYEDYLRTV
ncbi:MAG: hypothetical protein FWF81_01385 [Defluviitaleaceae bacterium]|nr:hypothetical protein [Defluviitaleaceae bacterium]